MSHRHDRAIQWRFQIKGTEEAINKILPDGIVFIFYEKEDVSAALIDATQVEAFVMGIGCP